ncbi:MAG: hypothetical protein Q8R39_00995 [bacterium]|nr:hypothetical protein [bacterium]MDZ4285062.1 hypothetical protein [Patescibacteria group bacterium]
MQNTKLSLTILGIFGLAFVSDVADAKSVSVQNIISVFSSSGGNVAREGEIVEGKAESEVFVETRVNGAVVESYDSRKVVEESAVVADLHTQQFNDSFESEDGSVETHVSLENSVGYPKSAGHRMSRSTVEQPMSTVSSSTNATATAEAQIAATRTAAATSSAATTSLFAAGASNEESAAQRSLFKRAFKFIAYVFSFKWIF